MTAVAVWVHAPTADDLLAERLRRGWSPALSATVDGPVALGHAACLALRRPGG